MVVNIPTFRLRVSNGALETERDPEYLFAYVIEAPKGPVLKPTFVQSNAEALEIFGVDFAAHFNQNPQGLLLIRVAYKDMKAASVTYQVEGLDDIIISRKTKGTGTGTTVVSITKDPDYTGYRLILKIPELGDKTYKGIKNLKTVFQRINNIAGEYITIENDPANISKETDEEKYAIVAQTGDAVPDITDATNENATDIGKLQGGSNGSIKIAENGNVGDTIYPAKGFVANSDIKTESGSDTTTYYNKDGSQKIYVDTSAQIKDAAEDFITYTPAGYIAEADKESTLGTTYYNADGSEEYSVAASAISAEEDTENEKTIQIYSKTTPETTKIFEQGIQATDPDVYQEITSADGTFVPSDVGAEQRSVASADQEEAFAKAFRVLEGEDVLGVSVLSASPIAHLVMLEHVQDMNESEVGRLRFGITAYIPDSFSQEKFEAEIAEQGSPYGDGAISAMSLEAESYNNEYIIYVGQGVEFRPSEGDELQYLPPHKAVQLYTGIRSALSYKYAIFGGEEKKVLIGVEDVIPFEYNANMGRLKEVMIELNESGVCIFKKEYGDVTFVEGVTTSRSDVLSHESIMSIVAHVSKRLIARCRPYQGQNLTEDLKATLKTALQGELQNITDTDKSLIALDQYNLAPYNVEVSSAAMVRFDEKGSLIRESKIVVKCKIVPVGALRDIDLGVIVI